MRSRSNILAILLVGAALSVAAASSPPPLGVKFADYGVTKVVKATDLVNVTVLELKSFDATAEVYVVQVAKAPAVFVKQINTNPSAMLNPVKIDRDTGIRWYGSTERFYNHSKAIARGSTDSRKAKIYLQNSSIRQCLQVAVAAA